MFRRNILIFILICIILIIYNFIRSKHYNNITLMTGCPKNMRNFFNKINGTWLLMPEDYDYNNIDFYRERKNTLHYYFIAITTFSMQTTILGFSEIVYSLDNPNNSEITIPYFSRLKKYLQLGHNYKLVKKIKAIFKLINLELIVYIIQDGDKTHLVETYTSPLTPLYHYWYRSRGWLRNMIS